jgi:hypothetical protein
VTMPDMRFVRSWTIGTFIKMGNFYNPPVLFIHIPRSSDDSHIFIKALTPIQNCPGIS